MVRCYNCNIIIKPDSKKIFIKNGKPYCKPLCYLRYLSQKYTVKKNLENSDNPLMKMIYKMYYKSE
jgi:hypothetical protein